jgi:transaldolase|tara:strand:+ start:172 stop:897 length:726 start_codon:yes stop_codon:yes gene_type:complete
MTDIQKLKIKIFADGADFESINKLNTKNYIRGFTTNPSLMKKAGIKNYKEFALKILSKIKDKPISFEVFSDDLIEMEKQAMEIASWGKNVNVKIPVTNTKKESTTEIIERLSNQGIECNITAIFTVNQLKNIVQVLNKNTPAILSVFAGRIADTGIDPENIMAECVQASKSKPKSEILWASTRELVNIFQADKIGCQIITVPHEILSKIDSIGKNLDDYSLDTVKSFYKDAVAAGFKINTK